MKSIFSKFLVLLLVVGLLLAVTPRQVQAQTAPVTPYGTWDAPTDLGVAGRPFVLNANGAYHMWYGVSATQLKYVTSTSPTFDISAAQVVSFTGTLVPTEYNSVSVLWDGTNFQLVTYGADSKEFAIYPSSDGYNFGGGTKIFTGSTTDFGSDFVQVDTPFLLKDGDNSYKLYFQVKTGVTPNLNYQIWSASSTSLSGTYILNANPAIAATNPARAHHPTVIKDGPTYYMFYTGTNQEGLYMATSLDGIAWTNYPTPLQTGRFSEPTVLKVDGSWHLFYEAGNIKHAIPVTRTLPAPAGRPAVIHDGTYFHMWYGTNSTLYYATSTDGDTFTPVAEVAFTGQVPNEKISVTVVKEADGFYMVAYNADADQKTFALYKSTDGINWVYQKDILTAPAGALKIDAPFLLQDGTGYKLYFQVKQDLTGTPYEIFMATADAINGFYTTGATAAIPQVGDVRNFHPTVVKDGTIYYMWFTDNDQNGLYVATSSDGINWTKSQNPLAVPGPNAEPAVLKVNGLWHLYHQGASPSFAIQHLTSSDPWYPAMLTIAPLASAVCGNTTTTTIDIYVEGIPTSTPLQAHSFRLHFDPTRTSVENPTTDVVNGGFIANGGILYTYWIDGSGNISTSPTGILEVVYTQTLPSTSTGSGKLASITLTHIGVPGDIALSITNVVLSTRDGLVIPSEASATATTLTLQPAVLNTTKDPDAGYCSLAQAVEDAVDGDNLKLVADIAIPEMVTVDKELTLDLNGKVATAATGINALHVTTGGALTVNDTGTTGKITGGTRAVMVNGGGSLTLNNGTLDGPGFDGVFVYGEGSSLTIDGGTITGLYYGISGNGSLTGQFAGSTTITINDGTVVGGETAIFHPQGGPLTITGGIITGGSYNGIEMKAGDLVITGGTITASGAFNASPAQTSNGNTQTGDAILIYNRAGYLGTMTVNISGNPIITSSHGYALREFTFGTEPSRTTSIQVTGGTFTGGLGTGNAGAAVDFMTVDPDVLMLTGGLYNTDPASPKVFVYVPYGTIPEGSMYRIVGISLNVGSFYYNNNNILRGVSTDFTVTNFVIADATSVTVELFSGSEGAYVLQQTNTLKTPASFNVSTLTSSFDIFGTYVSNSWNNSRQTEYGQNVPPTRVLVTVVLPGGTLTAEKVGPSFEYSLIDPVLVAEDFAYMAQSGVLGVTAGFHPVNFTLDQVLTLKVELFAGTQLLQTNISPVPSVHGVALLQQFSGPFDIFGTFDYTTDYATGTTVYWQNTREAEYGQTLVPTRVLATVTLPGGVTRTAENLLLTGDRATILPGVSGLVTLQGILTPKADVKLTLTSGAVVRDTFSTVQSSINYGFTGVETLTYTFTTSQARYLNITDASGKTFLVNGEKTLNSLRLYGGDVDGDNAIGLLDASNFGTDWGSTTDPNSNINFDGIVNIQDLALIGGNYGLTSATAYNWWSPLP